MPYSNISLYVLFYTHTNYRTLSSLPNPGGLSIYLSTHKAISVYTLYQAMVSLTVRKQSL